MLRWLGFVVGAFGLIAVAAACSSSSKPKATVTPGIIPATVFANGTVVIAGTPVTGQAAATIVAAATAGVPLTADGVVNAAPGTPGAAAGTMVTAAGTVVPGATLAPGQTPAPSAASGSVTAGSTPATGPGVAATPANVPPDAGFTLTVPPNPSGTFDVTANIVGPPAYGVFQVDLTFDASLLKVTGIDYGGAMGPANQVFCAPNTISAGRAIAACKRLGSTNVTNAGALAIFHFQVLSAGTTSLHFAPFASGGSFGTFLAPWANPAVAQEAITLPLHDATITVSP